MKDINFFEDHVDKREFKSDSNLIYILVFGIFCLLLIGYVVSSSLLIKKEHQVVSNLQQAVENPEAIRKMEEIKEKQMQISELEASVDKIRLLDQAVVEGKKVDDGLLKQINDSMPNDLFLTSLSIEGEGIYLSGISKDKWSIPEFQKNLASLENQEEIFVSHISLQDNYYNFDLDITLKGVEEDEPIAVQESQVDADEGTDQE